MFAGARQATASTSTLKGAPEVTRHASRKFPHRLNFYTAPPLEEITLEDFETWAIDRLRVLADIEAGQARNRSHDEIKAIVNARCKQYLPLSSNTAKSAVQDAERKKDQYGHFVLRLAFCRSEELRARFLRAECALFKIRFETDDGDERRQFLDSMNFDWVTVDQAEKREHSAALRAASFLTTDAKFEAESFFKVHWTRVTDLVSMRRVFIHKGQAYVPMKEQFSLVMAEFQSRLLKGLEMTARALPRLDEDDRLLPVLNHLSLGFMAGITSEYTVTTNADGEAITADMIASLSERSFPFCMRSLQNTLNSEHHLKYEGRGQYNLFLKGIGLSIEEALIFWRRSFSISSDDKFNKEYKYAIRHGYGLEGGRKNYSPRSCQGIIMGKAPGPVESHGCPFRHFNETNLASALQSSYKLSAGEQKEILASVKTQHYHLACTRLFEIQHASVGVVKGDGIGDGDSVDHPNKYFDASRKALAKAALEATAEEGVKMELDG